mgnify:CR=1 FL=1
MNQDAGPTPPEAPRTGLARTLLYAVLPVLVLLVLLESVARVVELWAPPATVDLGQGFTAASRLFVPAPDAPDCLVTNPDKVVSFQEQRFLRDKPPDTLRAFFLGGSSVNYLDYELPRLEERLAKRFDAVDRVEIINCGGLSYGSHRLVLIAREVLGYGADLLLVYSGHNEFEELEQLDLANLQTLGLQRALSRSALYRFVRDRLAARRIDALREARNRRILEQALPDTARTWRHEFTGEEKHERMDAYRRNLETIVTLCRERGAGVILGTVPSNLFRPGLPGAAGARYEREVLSRFAQGKYEEGRRIAQEILQDNPRHQASDRENRILRNLAETHDVPLADVEEAVSKAEPHGIPGETLFNDHCHLNPAGNRILAEVFEREILGWAGRNR